MNNTLRYNTPATCFNEALPIGNGRLGGMVYGGLEREKISLNDDTLWAGSTAPAPRPEAARALADVREMLFAGDRHAAEKLIEEKFQTTFCQPYLPAGNLLIDWPKDMDKQAYQRELSLNEALATVSHGADERCVRRTYFSSAADQVIGVQVLATAPLSTVTFRLESALKNQVSVSGNRIVLQGRAPSSVIWEEVESGTTENHTVEYDDTSRLFAIVLDVSNADGAVTATEDAITITGGQGFVLRVAITTDAVGSDPVSACCAQLDQCDPEFAVLKNRHISDFRRYYDQVSLHLSGPREIVTIPERLDAFSNGHNDPGLFELMFNYARYLLISASRSGTMPANLQGIWNEDVMPAWWSNYTVNINTQMNYWMAETCGLGDSHSALCDFVESLARAGKLTAKVQYGCDGWVTHHQTDYRRQTTPVGFSSKHDIEGSSKWSMWPMGGAWLSLHLFEHFRFGRDLDRLRGQTYPVMKGAAEFLLDWLIDDPRHQARLTTAPSTSPENTYFYRDGQSCSVSIGTTMDIAIVRALFKAVLEVSDLLGCPDPQFVARLVATQERLPDIQTTHKGIVEFDTDWPEVDPAHRHISHLFALCPGTEICPTETPVLANAARKSLLRRGAEGTGWALAWKGLCWARLGNSQFAYQHIARLLKLVPATVVHMAETGGGVYPNLLTACPPFQIDANFGLGAAIIEMLVQDHRSTIHLLPALPTEWRDGHLTGFRLRHGMTITMAWENGQLTSAAIESSIDFVRPVIYENMRHDISFKRGQSVDLMEFFVAEIAGTS